MVMAPIATKKILKGKKILITFIKCLIIPVDFTFAKKKFESHSPEVEQIKN